MKARFSRRAATAAARRGVNVCRRGCKRSGRAPTCAGDSKADTPMCAAASCRSRKTSGRRCAQSGRTGGTRGSQRGDRDRPSGRSGRARPGCGISELLTTGGSDGREWRGANVCSRGCEHTGRAPTCAGIQNTDAPMCAGSSTIEAPICAGAIRWGRDIRRPNARRWSRRMTVRPNCRRRSARGARTASVVSRSREIVQRESIDIRQDHRGPLLPWP